MKKIEPIKTTVRGETCWKLDYRCKGVRTRKYFATKEAAETELTSLKEQHKVGGEDWLSVPADVRLELLAGYSELQKLGLTISQVITRYRDLAAAHTPAALAGQVTLTVAIDKCIAYLTDLGNSARYIVRLEKFLRDFAKGREEMPLAHVTLDMVTEHFKRFGKFDKQSKRKVMSPRTRNSYQKFFSRFFRWAKLRAKLIAVNPIEGVFEKAKVEFKRPHTMTNEQVTKTLLWTHQYAPDLLGYVSLALFVGCRPEECDQVSWAMLDLDHGLAELPAEILKDGRPRQCHLHPTAVAWLKLAREMEASLPLPGEGRSQHQNRQDRISRFGKRYLGFASWPQDIFRHTAISMMVELYRDVARVALECGNSVSIIMEHYRDLVRPERCAEFWSLTPDVVLPKVAMLQEVPGFVGKRKARRLAAAAEAVEVAAEPAAEVAAA